MPIWPPHYLPTTGDEDFSTWPNQMQLPIGVDRTIAASQAFYDFTASAPGTAEAVASAIEQNYAGVIHHFVDNNRRAVGAGITGVNARSLDVPGMTLRYENNFGRERLRVTVSPEAQGAPGGLQLDINNDGYVAFFLYDPKFPNIINGKPGYPKSYDLYMNGYLIKRDFAVVAECQTFIVLFGLTALRCQSLVDKEHMNPFENQPPGLAPIVLPPRAKVNGDDDVFAYTVFNFTTDDNPVYNADTKNTIGGVTPVKINITGGLQFYDATKSPLNNKKGQLNYFGVTLSAAAGTQGTEDEVGYFIWTEFYSRSSVRPVTQSWNKTAAQNGVIIANDKPLFWGNHNITSYTSLTPGENAMGFNLYGRQGDDDVTDPVGSLQQQAANVAQFGQSITSEDDEALLTYYQDLEQTIQEFDARQLPIIQAAIAKVDDATKTYEDDNLQWEKDKSYVQLLDDQLATYDELIAQGGNPALYIVVIEDDQKALPKAKLKVMDDAMTVDDDIVKLNAANVALGDAESVAPNVPDKPTLSGDDISKFKYREITVSGDDFLFGDWQGG